MLSPATSVTRPPDDVSPLPTPILILPDVPDVADPVLTTIEPELPLDECPDFNDTLPLIPFEPASDVSTVNAPLLRLDPNPDDIDIEPPDTDVLSPALRTIRPPAPSSPLPTLTLIPPLVPDVDDPLRNTTEPLLSSSCKPIARRFEIVL